MEWENSYERQNHWPIEWPAVVSAVMKQPSAFEEVAEVEVVIQDEYKKESAHEQRGGKKKRN